MHALRLWLATVPQQPDPLAWERLSPAEQERCQRLATPFLQARFVFAHDLLRKALAKISGTPAEQLTLVRGDNGRPALLHKGSEPLAEPDLDFNLSYSGSLVACAVGCGGRVGVDIELVDNRLNYQRLTERVLSTQEHQWLSSLAPADRRAGFFSIWVLKEAYAKARGEGLGLAFNTFTLRPDKGSVVAALQGVGDQPKTWGFHRYQVRGPGIGDPPARALLAVATQPAYPLEPIFAAGPGLEWRRS